ncbi:MAG: hypothetical protein WCB31_08250 [Nitrososphaeraceae archaeon]
MLKVFQNASNLLSLSSPSNEDNSRKLDIFKNKPFYFEIQKHNGIDCCFNHLIGLPQKNNKEYPLFDYEQLIINAIENNQHVWIKKSRGIGVTELVLRYLVWVSLSSNKLDGKSIFLVSGTHENFSNDIKNRMERLFERRFPDIKFESKYTDSG